VTAVTHTGWTLKSIVYAAAIVSLASIAVVVTIGLDQPDPARSAALGPQWQCSRMVFVWTTCTRVKQAEAASVRLPGNRSVGG